MAFIDGIAEQDWFKTISDATDVIGGIYENNKMSGAGDQQNAVLTGTEQDQQVQNRTWDAKQAGQPQTATGIPKEYLWIGGGVVAAALLVMAMRG